MPNFCGPLYHGKGKRTFPDESVYEGQFREGKACGQGKKVTKNGTYEGTWDDGKLVVGKCVMNNGKGYEGEWKDNKFNGKGIKYYPDGSALHGNFLNNIPYGKGKRVLADGTIQFGEWEADKWIPSESKEFIIENRESKEEEKEYLNK